MELDKYSKYIKQFINKIKLNQNFNIDDNNKFIKNILNISKNINNSEIKIPSYDIQIIKKIHNKDEYPLLYDIIRKMNLKIKNFKDFLIYYTLNQTNIDIENLIKDIPFDENRNELKDIFYNSYQSIDIIQEIESNDLNHIVIKTDYYKLSLYYYDIKNIDDEIIKIIKVINLIREINKFYKINQNDFYNVIIFFGNKKKYLFNERKIITPMNINSGATIIKEYASVWRKEELEKVLIHELLHYIGIDHKLFINDNDKINKLFNVTKNKINESYNETLAGIINMCWKSQKHNININELYLLELKFLLFQTVKIIKYFDGKYVDDLFTIKISQTSWMLSYIILKMILFCNINDIINFIESINLKINSDDDINKYIELLEKKIKNKNYIIQLNDIFNINYNSEYLNKTMRMTVL
jgi:hypothetical protein